MHFYALQAFQQTMTNCVSCGIEQMRADPRCYAVLQSVMAKRTVFHQIFIGHSSSIALAATTTGKTKDLDEWGGSTWTQGFFACRFRHRGQRETGLPKPSRNFPSGAVRNWRADRKIESAKKVPAAKSLVVAGGQREKPQIRHGEMLPVVGDESESIR